MLLVKNGWVVDPGSGLEGIRDVLVCEGKVVKIAEGISVEDVDRLVGAGTHSMCGSDAQKQEDCSEVRVIDAAGMVVAPGLVDVHVHFRDPGFTHKEDILTGAQAAVKGGFTSIVLMANTKPTVDSVETLRYVIEKGKETGIRIETCANVTLGMQGKELTDMDALSEAGAVGFTDDGVPLLDEQIVKQAMEILCKTWKAA